MSDSAPIIGITMGDPVGIGPEIVLKALNNDELYRICRPLVLGDSKILETAAKALGLSTRLNPVTDPGSGRYRAGSVDIMNLSRLDPGEIAWGSPTAATGRAMIAYINEGIDLAMQGKTHAIVTAPINKAAMKLAGARFHGHTELLAARTGADEYAMMMAGDKLKVVLVTIHIPLSKVPSAVTGDRIGRTVDITVRSLKERFGLQSPRIAVAGLNPHAGEEGMFGTEEETVIVPAVNAARERGVDITGPMPPDTVFFKAAQGEYDAVITMYHDQGLIPFKLLHFEDGVNTTLGLPIIRTSVDHGTAYDIAGMGIAGEESLTAAIRMAALQAREARKRSAAPAA